MFEIKIATDNAAFDAGWQGEVARILSELVGRLAKCDYGNVAGGQLYDANGNYVGHWLAPKRNQDKTRQQI